MDAIGEYSSSDDEETPLPGVPAEILNKFSKTPKIRASPIAHNGGVSSFIYVNVKLSPPQKQILAATLPVGYTALFHDQDLKIDRDLHVSLTWNFQVPSIQDLDGVINKLRAGLTSFRRFPIRTQQHLTVLPSKTTEKRFLAFKLQHNPHLVELCEFINANVAELASAYESYNVDHLHLSIAALNSEEKIDYPSKSLVFVVDNVCITKVRQVESITLPT